MRYLLILCFASLIAGCASATAKPAWTPGPTVTPMSTPLLLRTPRCVMDDGTLAVEHLEALAMEWEAARAAEGRRTMAGSLQELQRVRDSAQRRDWPWCARAALDHLLHHMAAVTGAHFASMHAEPSAYVRRYFDIAVEQQIRFNAEVVKLRTGP